MTAMPSTRAEARAQGSTVFFTGRPCARGHLSLRKTAGGTCIACSRLWMADRPEEEIEASTHVQNRLRRPSLLDRYDRGPTDDTDLDELIRIDRGFGQVCTSGFTDE